MVNQVGVPLRNSEEISLATATGLVRATAWREDGRTLYRAREAEALGMRLVLNLRWLSSGCLPVDLLSLLIGNSEDCGGKSEKGCDGELHVYDCFGELLKRM